MFCQSCGEILPDGAHFCPKCGQSCAAQVEIPDNINFSFDDELTPVDKETEVVCRKTTTDISLTMCLTKDISRMEK